MLYFRVAVSSLAGRHKTAPCPPVRRAEESSTHHQTLSAALIFAASRRWHDPLHTVSTGRRAVLAPHFIMDGANLSPVADSPPAFIWISDQTLRKVSTLTLSTCPGDTQVFDFRIQALHRTMTGGCFSRPALCRLFVDAFRPAPGAVDGSQAQRHRRFVACVAGFFWDEMTRRVVLCPEHPLSGSPGDDLREQSHGLWL